MKWKEMRKHYPKKYHPKKAAACVMVATLTFGNVGANMAYAKDVTTDIQNESSSSELETISLEEQFQTEQVETEQETTLDTETSTTLESSVTDNVQTDNVTVEEVTKEEITTEEVTVEDFSQSQTEETIENEEIETNILYGNSERIIPEGETIPAETLTDRGLVAINLSGSDGGETNTSTKDSGVFLSWRSFSEDFDTNNNVTTTYTIYKNGTQIETGYQLTNYHDASGKQGDVYKVVGSNDSQLGLQSVKTKAWDNKYQEFQLQQPEPQTMPDGTVCTYSANDLSVGDLDGDGQYELIVKWYPSNAQDNSKAGYTGTTILDGYDIDIATGKATLMWRIDLGVNIRSGAHYTQFQVWDFDGDGNAEIAVKTADGSTTYENVNGQLTQTGFVGACDASALPTNKISEQNDYRNSAGYVLDGPEYFTIFDGKDGKIIDTVEYTPQRGNVGDWGDTYGNRVDRFLSGVAYLDGKTPSAIFARGYYTRTVITAYTLENGKIKENRVFDTNEQPTDSNGNKTASQGNHGLSINDVDGDGYDEIIYGSLTVDHNGLVLYSTGLGHGDAMHVSDWIPSNDGLEIMQVHEEKNAKYHVEIHDAETGEIILAYYTGKDTGRGVAADIDPTSYGGEFWSNAAPLYSEGEKPAWSHTKGAVLGSDTVLGEDLHVLSETTPSVNFSIFWDGDLLSEVQDHTFNSTAYQPTGITVSDWDYENQKEVVLLSSTEAWSNNGTKGNMGLVADVLGDWREEIITRSAGDNGKVRIYSTTIETDYVVPTLTEDRAYREGVSWQNVGYNQPANTSYLLSEGVVTAQIKEASVTKNNITFDFTKASDGSIYGHEVIGYHVYRSENGGEYQLYSQLNVSDLVEKDIAQSTENSTEEVEQVDLKFDFGSESLASGWTRVTASDLYSVDTNYGFVDKGSPVNKKGGTSTDETLKDVYYDFVRTTDEGEFVVNVPNGTYEVTLYATNGSADLYCNYFIEGEEVGSIETNSKNYVEKAFTKTIKVYDGTLNVKGTAIQKNLVQFSGLTITSVASDDSTNNSNQVQKGYEYTDSNVKSDTTYCYKIAAVVNVNGNTRESYMSNVYETKTLVDIQSVSEIVLDDLVQNTILNSWEDATVLLPKTVSVIDVNGNTVQADVTWDISKLDLTVPGEYTVIANVNGWDTPISVLVTVKENVVTSFEAINKIYVRQKEEAILPTTVMAKYLNGETKEVSVTWETVNTSTLGLQTIKGTVNQTTLQPKVEVHIVEDFVTSLQQIASVDIVKGSKTVQLPTTLKAVFKSGVEKDVAVTWDTSKVDTSVIGIVEVTGTIKEYSEVEEPISTLVNVGYPVVSKFDFGIDNNTVADGWTTITVNPKGGTQTADDLSITYIKEKGYGFLDGTAIIQGRNENYTYNGILESQVYKDFAIPDGQTFVVDVENGTYYVEVISGSEYSSNVAVMIEGNDKVSVSNTKGQYNIGGFEAEVEDGQLTLFFPKGNTSRLNGIIIREVVETVEEPEVPETDESKAEESETQEPETDESKAEETEAQEPETDESKTEETEAQESKPETSESESSQEEESSSESNTINQLIDISTNIKVSYEKGVLPEGVQLISSKSLTEKQKQAVEEAFKAFNGKVTVYDIKLLKDGMQVKPNGEVTVSMPVPNGYDKDNISVYYVNEKGEKEELTFTNNGIEVSFKTDHFSMYAIAQIESAGSTETGDVNNISMVATMLCLSFTAMTVLVFVKKRRSDI